MLKCETSVVPPCLFTQKSNENKKTVLLLLSNGAASELADAFGKTAYDYAIESGKTDIAELLKPAGE